MGKCTCLEGFSGDYCEERSCKYNCHEKGKCNIGKCDCSPGYSGEYCEIFKCKDNCRNNGICDYNSGKCVCYPGKNDLKKYIYLLILQKKGFSGEICSEVKCPNDCSGNGVCLQNGKCKCKTTYYGGDCSQQICHNNCNGLYFFDNLLFKNLKLFLLFNKKFYYKIFNHRIEIK